MAAPAAAVFIGLGLEIVERIIRLIQTANQLPDANSPEALAKLKELETKLLETAEAVKQLEIKEV